MERNNNENIVRPLNAELEINDGDNIIFCPIDCGSDDVCDSCDGICRPKVR